MASPLPPEVLSPFEQGMAAMPLSQRQEVMAGLDAAKNFDLGAYQAQFRKAEADREAALKAAQATGLSDEYTPLYGGADIVPGMTQGILSNLGIENPYMPVYALRGSANKGGINANERMQFAPTPGVSYRLVDKNTGQTTTASTPEEIKALIQQSNALSAAGGKKADLAIESNQTGNWSPIYTDEPNIVMDTPMKLIAAGMLAATGAGLLQPGGLGGLGAGASGVGGAGAGLGTTASLAPGALSSLPANLAAIQAGANTALASAGLGAGTAAGLGAGTAAGLGSSALGSELAPILVTAQGSNFVLPSVAALTAGLATPALAGTSAAPSAVSASNLAQNEFGSVVTPEGEIVATATTPTNLLPPAIVASIAGGGAAAADALANAAETTSFEDIAASQTGMTPEEIAALNAGAGAGGVLGTGLTPLQAALIGSTVLGVVDKATSGGGGGTPGTGTQALNPIFSAKLPTPGEGGSFRVGGLGPRVAGPGGTFSARPTTDWYRFGMGPAMDIPAGTDLSRATSPYAGYGPGTLGQTAFDRIVAGLSPVAPPRRELLPNMVSSLGRDATSAQIEAALTGAKTAEEARRLNPGTVYFNIDAGTANALGDPSLVGTVMSIQDLQRRMAARPVGRSHGGSMGYARGSSRESFAVNGPGTGRSDEIPAVLSDGEYVIDAETVALLGDGSSKAGAKKLDEMRVKIRKHKGRNLAKGKFSVNAKRPEKYLSGGRA